MSIRWLIRGVACGAVFAASATTSRTPGAEPEPRYFCTQVGAYWGARIHRIVPGPDGSVYAAGYMGSHDSGAMDLGGLGIGPAYPRNEIFVVRIAPGGAVDWVSRVETREYPDGDWWGADVTSMALAEDGSVWVAGSGGITPVGMPDLGATEDWDAWVAKFAPDGTPAFATNVGGTKTDYANDLALTPDGDAILVGGTRSTDFPVVGAFQPAHGGGLSDGFVTRVRGDGSGIAWSSYLGGADANAVAVAADGAILVATSAGLTRVSADGAVLPVFQFPPGFGGIFAFAVEPDGRILAGGWRKTDVPPNFTDSLLLRLSPDGAEVEREWSEAGRVVRQITLAPDGAVLLSTYWLNSSIVVPRLVAAGLNGASQPIDLRRFDSYGTQTMLAPDGALCLLDGKGGLPFGDAAPSSVETRMHVARLPLSGTNPPSRLRMLNRGRRAADLEWSDDGDPATEFLVETSVLPETYDWKYVRASTFPGDARSARLTGLTPGQVHFVRLISTLPSGVRVVSPSVVTFRTELGEVSDVQARRTPGGAVAVTFRDRNGDSTHYEVHCRSNGGPWRRVAYYTGPYYYDHIETGLHHVPDRRALGFAETRTYRVRAGVGAMRTPWIETNAVSGR